MCRPTRCSHRPSSRYGSPAPAPSKAAAASRSAAIRPTRLEAKTATRPSRPERAETDRQAEKSRRCGAVDLWLCGRRRQRDDLYDPDRKPRGRRALRHRRRPPATAVRRHRLPARHQGRIGVRDHQRGVDQLRLVLHSQPGARLRDARPTVRHARLRIPVRSLDRRAVRFGKHLHVQRWARNGRSRRLRATPTAAASTAPTAANTTSPRTHAYAYAGTRHPTGTRDAIE
jgi:hypothetical protein